MSAPTTTTACSACMYPSPRRPSPSGSQSAASESRSLSPPSQPPRTRSRLGGGPSIAPETAPKPWRPRFHAVSRPPGGARPSQPTRRGAYQLTRHPRAMPTLINNLPDRESLSIGEAISHTGLSQRAILHGALPTYMTDGEWRVPTAAVRAYLEWQRDGLPLN